MTLDCVVFKKNEIYLLTSLIGKLSSDFGLHNYVVSKTKFNLEHGLLYKWTELLYLTCPHEADLLTLTMSQKPTQYL